MNLTILYTVLVYNINAFFLIYLIDRILLKCNISQKRESTRWFQLHTIINICIAYSVYEDIVICLYDPTKSNETTITEWGRSFALSLHIYHSIIYKLRREDWYHHIISVFLCAPMCIINNTKAVSFSYFFCTGLPGAIDYATLSLVRTNYITRIKQKQIASYLNTYVRMPGGGLGAYLIFKDAFQPTEIHINRIVLAFLMYLNSFYYGNQAIGSYYKAKTEDIVFKNVENKSKQRNYNIFNGYLSASR